MSTKINVRSPYYLDIQEPTPPQVELTCNLIALKGLAVDEFGNVSLPNPEYGDILSYDSTDVDFEDGKFDTVLTDTSRTITFRISIPSNFTNSANDYIDCSATATQPAFVCTGGITATGSIPNQSLNSGGNTVTINLSSYFTQGVLPIAGYNITNSYPTYFSATTSGNNLLISSENKAGTHTLYVEAFDGDSTTCNATQSVQVTVISTETYDCSDSYIQGGLVNQDGSIFLPNANGVITATRTSPLGTPITSLSANNTGSFIVHTLYFDITVPTGYTNTGATVQCSKNFTQVSSTLPVFNCEVASLTGQAIYTSGAILQGNAGKGTISSFSPSSFLAVDTNTPRSVTFYVTPPASGYSNSGGSDIECTKSLIQPTLVGSDTLGDTLWFASYAGVAGAWEYIYKADNPAQTQWWRSVEGWYDNRTSTPALGSRSAYFVGTNPANWVGTYTWYLANYNKKDRVGYNYYLLVSRTTRTATPIQNLDWDWYVYQTSTGLITEVWKYFYNTKTGIRIA
jgi:hypothetical protein